MLFKELLPPVVAALLLAKWCPDIVLASATDNAGAAFVAVTTKAARMEVHFIVHDLWTGEAFAATVSFRRPTRRCAKPAGR